MNDKDNKTRSDEITNKKIFQFALIAPVAGLITGMWGNVQFFAVSVLLIPQLFIAIIYLVYSLVDAFNDPIIGYLTDRSIKYTPKFGKRYLWIIIGVLFTPIFLILCFIPVSNDIIISTIWLIIQMAIYETFLTLHEVSQKSLFPDMFREQYHRRKVSIFGGIIGGLTLIFGAIFIPLSIGIWGGEFSAPAYLITCIIIVIIAYILTIPYLKGVKETGEMISFRTKLDQAGKSSSPLKEVLNRIFKDRNWVALIISNTCFVIAGACVLYGLNFYVVYNLEQPIEVASIPALFYSLVAISFVPIWIKVAKKFGIKKTYTTSLFLNVIGFFLFLFVNSLTTMTLILMIIGITSSANQTVIFDLATAEAIDNAAVNSGKREEGTYIGVLRVFSAFSYFFQTLIFAIIGTLFGFDASLGTNQTYEAKLGLNFQMSLIPMFILLIGATIFLFMYAISKEKAQENVKKLSEMGL